MSTSRNNESLTYDHLIEFAIFIFTQTEYAYQNISSNFSTYVKQLIDNENNQNLNSTLIVQIRVSDISRRMKSNIWQLILTDISKNNGNNIRNILADEKLAEKFLDQLDTLQNNQTSTSISNVSSKAVPMKTGQYQQLLFLNRIDLTLDHLKKVNDNVRVQQQKVVSKELTKVISGCEQYKAILLSLNSEDHFFTFEYAYMEIKDSVNSLILDLNRAIQILTANSEILDAESIAKFRKDILDILEAALKFLREHVAEVNTLPKTSETKSQKKNFKQMQKDLIDLGIKFSKQDTNNNNNSALIRFCISFMELDLKKNNGQFYLSNSKLNDFIKNLFIIMSFLKQQTFIDAEIKSFLRMALKVSSEVCIASGNNKEMDNLHKLFQEMITLKCIRKDNAIVLNFYVEYHLNAGKEELKRENYQQVIQQFNSAAANFANFLDTQTDKFANFVLLLQQTPETKHLFTTDPKIKHLHNYQSIDRLMAPEDCAEFERLCVKFIHIRLSIYKVHMILGNEATDERVELAAYRDALKEINFINSVILLLMNFQVLLDCPDIKRYHEQTLEFIQEAESLQNMKASRSFSASSPAETGFFSNHSNDQSNHQEITRSRRNSF